MNELRVYEYRELFARLFVIAIKNQTHPDAFIDALSKSEFVQKLERGYYDDYFNKPILEIYNAIMGQYVDEDRSFGVYNDAYWCGLSYFDLHLRLHKPFSYLFLKLPLSELLERYPVYHEMDFSSLLEYFLEREKEKTILRALCEKHCKTLTKLSKLTGISVNTLSKYNASDEALYKGSFVNIAKIAKYFEEPFSLFEKTLIQYAYPTGPIIKPA